MYIRQCVRTDLPGIAAVWNASVRDHEVVYFPMDEAALEAKFWLDPSFDPAYCFVAEDAGEVVGFIIGICQKRFLNGEDAFNTPGYLNSVFVRRDHRRAGVGTALMDAMTDAFRRAGKTTVAVNNNDPVNLSWTIPTSPGHDHNNAPGVDEDCPGFEFLKALGFTVTDREIALYLPLEEYKPWPGMEEARQRLLREGIYTGRFIPDHFPDYDRICDRVGSEYWRSVIASEMACYRENRPCTDPRYLPDGRIPSGPRPLLVAEHEGHIVGFTGPVDLQKSGRGWFTGIFTDPMYEKRSIASVLFHLLMREFILEGASFSSIFTGIENHAQKIYLRAGFRIVRTFSAMKKEI